MTENIEKGTKLIRVSTETHRILLEISHDSMIDMSDLLNDYARCLKQLRTEGMPKSSRLSCASFVDLAHSQVVTKIAPIFMGLGELPPEVAKEVPALFGYKYDEFGHIIDTTEKPRPQPPQEKKEESDSK
jgi:hypothetical protein